jgi:hypothetical protein
LPISALDTISIAYDGNVGIGVDVDAGVSVGVELDVTVGVVGGALLEVQPTAAIRVSAITPSSMNLNLYKGFLSFLQFHLLI